MDWRLTSGTKAEEIYPASRVYSYLKSALSDERRERLRRLQRLHFRTLQHYLSRALFGRDLRALAWFYETDKSVGHSYVTHYQTHFAPLRLRRLNILEIGIGGYEDPEAGGGSLRMWRAYFPHSRVFGIDIYEKNH